jgi:hypothetical protein
LWGPEASFIPSSHVFSRFCFSDPAAKAEEGEKKRQRGKGKGRGSKSQGGGAPDQVADPLPESEPLETGDNALETEAGGDGPAGRGLDANNDGLGEGLDASNAAYDEALEANDEGLDEGSGKGLESEQPKPEEAAEPMEMTVDQVAEVAPEEEPESVNAPEEGAGAGPSGGQTPNPEPRHGGRRVQQQGRWRGLDPILVLDNKQVLDSLGDYYGFKEVGCFAFISLSFIELPGFSGSLNLKGGVFWS